MGDAEAITRPMNTGRMFDKGIPCLRASGRSLAEAWENSMLELWKRGCNIENQYEEALAEGHPLSIDATMMIVVEDPMSEPAIHRSFPGGLEDLEEYRLEFVEGIKDHWVKHPDDPSYAGEWTYTYHQRFSQYDYLKDVDDVGITMTEDGKRPINGSVIAVPTRINQLEMAVDALVKSPHTRRVKIVTWQPWLDPFTSDPPCLGEFWLRCSESPKGLVLNGNAVFRSRDAFDAAFMNLWGEAAFMEKVAGELQVKLGRPVKVGRLCDISHSYHIYGKRIEAFKDGFLANVEKRTFEERTWTREFAQEFFDEARPKIYAKIKEHDSRKD